MDGVLNSDHTPRSALIEYKKAVEPVQVLASSAGTVTVINRLDFSTLDYLDCAWSVSNEDGQGSDNGHLELPTGIAPAATAELAIPVKSGNESLESFLNLSFKLRESTLWAEKGHEVAFLQIPLSNLSAVTTPTVSKAVPLKVDASPTALRITGSRSEWQLDLVNGTLASWLKDGEQLITKAVGATFYRAPTDNDAPRDGKEWKERFMHLARVHTRSVNWHQDAQGEVRVGLDQKFAPVVLSWSIDLRTEYVFSPAGTVRLSVTGTPTGQNLPSTLPRLGVTLGLPSAFNTAKWFGRGPGESYKDMKLSQRVGLHTLPIDQLWTGPEFPQESSNRTDTRWLEVSSPHTTLTAQFATSKQGTERHVFDFMASHYDVKDIDEAQHPYELEERRKEEVILRLDADHHGLGECSASFAWAVWINTDTGENRNRVLWAKDT